MYIILLATMDVRSALGVSIMHIFGEILEVLAQVHWQPRGLTGYDQGTPEPRLSIDPWPCWERSAA